MTYSLGLLKFGSGHKTILILGQEAQGESILEITNNTEQKCQGKQRQVETSNKPGSFLAWWLSSTLNLEP
jgi:hypothetical protein